VSMFRGNPNTNDAARYQLALQRWLAGPWRHTPPPEPEGELARALLGLNGPKWRAQAAENAREWAEHGGRNAPRHCLCELCRAKR